MIYFFKGIHTSILQNTVHLIYNIQIKLSIGSEKENSKTH